MSVSIKKIDEHTWSFEETGVRFFLLEGKERAMLIDSGMETHNAKELARSLTSLPLSLLNTHADRDHTGSNDEFESFYMSPSESVNYFCPRNRKGTILPVYDQEEIDLGNRVLRIIEIPGHTPGSIAILDCKNRRIFTGDPVQDGRIFMFGPYREMHAYRLSLLRLWGYREEFDEIYPSHGTCPIAPDYIMKLYDASGKVMSGRIKGEEKELFGHQILAYDTGVAVYLCDRE